MPRKHTTNNKNISKKCVGICVNKCMDNNDDYVHETPKTEQDLDLDIMTLENKYSQYSQNNKQKYKNDPYDELIKEKDKTINKLRHIIEELKIEKIDLSILYNEKIEMLRTENKKNLLVQHKQYIKNIDEIKNRSL